MKVPEWTGPAIWSAIGGAVVVTIVAFSAGWVVSSGAAQEMAQERVNEAVTTALTPYCVANFENMPQQRQSQQLADLESQSSWEQADFVAERGWATLAGSEEPNEAVAEACANQILDRSAA